MGKYQHILWDLDGTLTDPASGITKSVQYALRKFGIESELEPLKPFIGPPLTDSFIKYFNFSPADADRAVECYREYYREKGIFDNFVYDGIPELLAKLKADGREIILATSKPIVFADKILAHFDLKQYFDATFGADLAGNRMKKSDVIDYALTHHSIDITKAVMVGDREYDILGAHAFGIPAIGVLFGYGSREELENAGAERIAATVAELGKLLD